MMTKWFRLILTLGTIIIFVLPACGKARGEPTETAPVPIMATPTQSNFLATPYAQQPAAGICASFEGEIVIVTLNPDVPDPRCAKVKAYQKLTIVNHSQDTLQISIGRFTSSLKPGEETIIDIPFGEYLEPGVHQLQVSPCCGPELWLEE